MPGDGRRCHPPLLKAAGRHGRKNAEILPEHGGAKGTDCVAMKGLMAGEDG